MIMHLIIIYSGKLMKMMALLFLEIEVYTCINGLNLNYLNNLFTIKKCKYDLRDDSVINKN